MEKNHSEERTPREMPSDNRSPFKGSVKNKAQRESCIPPGGTKKMTINLSEELDSALEEIAAQTGTSKTEALRRAIGLDKFLLDERKRGSKILLEDKNKKLREVLIR